MDRVLIAAVIRRLYPTQPDTRSQEQLARKAGLSRATVARAIADPPSERTEVATYQSIEAALGLPMDTLVTIGAHEFGQLRSLGVDRSLISWVRRTADAGSKLGKASSVR